MPAVVKRTKTWKEKLPPGKSYSIDDALKLVKLVAGVMAPLAFLDGTSGHSLLEVDK